MARFSGAIGYGSDSETAPGVWTKVITERTYSGDVVRNARQLEEKQAVNKDILPSNSISIVADAYALNNFFAICYIRWQGVLWTVTNVEVQSPRLLLRLGGVYNGPTP